MPLYIAELYKNCTLILSNETAKDQTIRIWNYDTGNVELVKKYQVDVTSVALHPSGIFVAVGFNDQLRLMEILLDDLKVSDCIYLITILTLYCVLIYNKVKYLIF